MTRMAGILVALALLPAPPGLAGDPLLFHAEWSGGEVLASRGADEPFNPASVLKVGTTWWALERLGPDHRYTTVFAVTGRWDPRSGVLRGSLVVRGGGDPDFQYENAFLVARELVSLGLREVRHGLRVEGPFSMGWEGGPVRRSTDAGRRALEAGRRLIRALDPARWGPEERTAWRKVCARRGWDPSKPPALRISGEVSVDRAPGARRLVEHRSNPLPVLLKRFNVYSNNDIERIADGLGGAAELETFLRERLEDREGRLVAATACGEGSNVMTARLVVRMLRRFGRFLAGKGLAPRDVLPVPGCDPGPVPRMFPALAEAGRAGAFTVKTGTLRETDGGVAVLAGWFTAPSGREVLFCVASPRAGRELGRRRALEQAWLLGLVEEAGGVLPVPCGAPLVFSDTGAVVRAVGRL